ncbi:hypothetical protein DFH11DRAFT_364180 [Phellopilus nigrolimitatus]|nr:hypothetical protein DFH11DRAFT_364180 [Phellopilus nigrolimitatus]
MCRSSSRRLQMALDFVFFSCMFSLWLRSFFTTLLLWSVMYGMYYTADAADSAHGLGTRLRLERRLKGAKIRMRKLQSGKKRLGLLTRTQIRRAGPLQEHKTCIISIGIEQASIRTFRSSVQQISPFITHARMTARIQTTPATLFLGY